MVERAVARADVQGWEAGMDAPHARIAPLHLSLAATAGVVPLGAHLATARTPRPWVCPDHRHFQYLLAR
jgi:hypothetical protein